MGCRKNIFLFALTLGAIIASAGSSSICRSQSITPPKKLQVVVIAVTSFTAPDPNKPEIRSKWDNAVLTNNIQRTANQLRNFFEKEFGADVHLLMGGKDTTKNAIELLFDDGGKFEQWAEGNTTLLFILSHGKSQAFKNDVNKSDVLILTSDSGEEPNGATAIEFTDDILNKVMRLKRGSVVYVFLDTCHAGAAADLQLDIEASVQNKLGVKMMVMGAALSEETAAKATFTQALLRVWAQPGRTTCTEVYSGVKTLRESIAALLHPRVLKEFEGNPRVIVPFKGRLCMESFAPDSALLFVYNPLKTRISVAADSLTGQYSSEAEVIDPDDVQVLRVPRERYNIRIKTRTALLEMFQADLSAPPYRFHTVRNEVGAVEVDNDTDKLAAAYEKAREIALFTDLKDSGAQEFGKLAYQSYVVAKNKTAADKLLPLLIERESPDSLWLTALKLANESMPKVLAEIELKKINKDALAQQLQLVGDFRNAGELFYQMAKENPGTAELSAEKAYFSFASVADQKRAGEIRKEYNLKLWTKCPECIEAEETAQKTDTPETKQLFQSLGTRAVLFPVSSNAAVYRPNTQLVASGQTRKIKGVVVKRDTDTFTIRDIDGVDRIVLLTDTTSVKTHGGFLRGGVNYQQTNILRGLNLEVEGRGNAHGDLVAEKIRFSDFDLKVARAVESGAAPLEERATDADEKLSEVEAAAQRLSGQLDELAGVSNAARGGAKNAQATADRAIASINATNERISALDDYIPQSTTAISFRSGSALLTSDSQRTLDKLAGQVSNMKGYILEISGFANSSVSLMRNRSLTQRRSEAVIRYLVEKHSVPLRRIVTIFGLGKTPPLADNSTSEGRTQNRRVEIKVLVNTGIVGEVPMN